jgi:hypothetical protein
MALVHITNSAAPVVRVFPARNQWTPDDPLAFFTPPPSLTTTFPRDTQVMVSCTFTWQRARAEWLAQQWRAHYPNTCVGGPAYGDGGGEFTPGMFLKRGCTITSRGCPKDCGWCDVHKREGALRELSIKPGWIVQDNNLLACSERHIRAVFDMLRGQERRIYFNGGLDKDFLKPWHRELFESIKLGELWFACDRGKDFERLKPVAEILAGIPLRKRRCYTMIGFDGETLEEAQQRIEAVFALGFMPFCQLYQPAETRVYPNEWRDLRYKWSRPAAYMGKSAGRANEATGAAVSAQMELIS